MRFSTIYFADFLGDLGIAHRNIQPKNVLLRETVSKYSLAKLTNFQKAVIYWNVEESDIVLIPCRDVKCQISDGNSYQPPEVSRL